MRKLFFVLTAVAMMSFAVSCGNNGNTEEVIENDTIEMVDTTAIETEVTEDTIMGETVEDVFMELAE